MRVDILSVGAGVVLAAEIAANEFVMRRHEKRSAVAPTTTAGEGQTIYVAPQRSSRRVRSSR